MNFTLINVDGNDKKYSVTNMITGTGTINIIVSHSNKLIILYNNSPFYSDLQLAYFIYKEAEKIEITNEYYIISIKEDGLEYSYIDYEKMFNKYHNRLNRKAEC
jgi:hypothetical protein